MKTFQSDVANGAGPFASGRRRAGIVYWRWILVDRDDAMHRRAFWRAVTVDRSDLLDRFPQVLRKRNVRYCVIGGQAVNAYADPVVSLDLDLAVVAADLANLEPVLRDLFIVERFPHSLNISDRSPAIPARARTERDSRPPPLRDAPLDSFPRRWHRRR